MSKFTLSSKVENEKWTSAHTWTFISMGLGVLMSTYIYTLSYVATGWYPVTNVFLRVTLEVWPIIWYLIGIAFLSPFIDKFGRRTMFFATLILYAIGVIGIIVSGYYLTLLFSIAIAEIAAGGETNAVFASTHEMFPKMIRGKIYFLEIALINTGGFLVGLLGFISAYSTVAFQREVVGVAIVPMLIVILISRIKMPESVRWLEAKGKNEKAKEVASKYYNINSTSEIDVKNIDQDVNVKKVIKGPGFALKMLVAIFLVTASQIGFGLFILTLGPTFYPSQTTLIIAVSDGIEALSVLGLAFFVDKISRKKLVLAVYSGALLMTVLIYLLFGVWSIDLVVFWTFLIILNFFLAALYAGETTLRSEIWKTEHRSTYLGIPRVVSYLLLITSIYLTASLSLKNFTLYNIVIWVVGVAGALIWYFKGTETGKGVSIGVASGESSIEGTSGET
ncbi:MAG: MFS transporter [Nitrososphaerota archaeon]|jgi:MFS family permease|nr:MFS transporter [Nitrososphaerota archaeon]MDG7039868.1 MFS transporter [Nitrososphaerota archaeon]